MGILKTFAMLTSVCIVGMSVYLYTPLPDDISEAWKVRSYIAVGKIIRLVGFVGDTVGVDSSLSIIRSIAKQSSMLVASKSDPVLKVTDTTFDGIKVRVYRPKEAPIPTPALVYYHGGGWSHGNIDLYDTLTAEIAKSANIVVVSVDYRLAPEYPYPKPFDDCVTATLHLMQNPEKYGVDGSRIAVAGDDTGGNIAAALAKRFSEEPPQFLQRLKFHILIYPALQAFDFNLPSYQQFQDFYPLTKESMIMSWLGYMGVKDPVQYVTDFSANNHTAMILKYSEYATGVSQELLPERFQTSSKEIVNKNEGNDVLSRKLETTVLSPYVAPLMALNLSQVSPSFVVTADFDVLRDDGLIYTERLRKAGVTVNSYHIKLAGHGFCMPYLPFKFAKLEACQKAINEIVNYIEENIHS